MSESSESPDNLGIDFPDEYSQGIAKVISFWSCLESHINMSVWHLAGVYPAIGVCLTEQIFTLDGRLKALLALLKLRRAPDDLVRRVNKFSERVRRSQEIRNRVVHDTWHQGAVTKEMVQLKIGAKDTLSYGFKKIAIEDLISDQETVRRSMVEALELRNSIEDALPTLPEIPLGELHPVVFHSGGRQQTRATDRTFVLFPPKPS
jgi:hypothetical protein